MAAVDQEWRAAAARPMVLAALSLVLVWSLMRNDPKRDVPTKIEAARSPCAEPVRKNFLDILQGLYTKMNDDRILAVAGGLAFFGLLALFPGIAAFVALYGLFGDWSTINGHLGTVTFMLPHGSAEIIADEVKRVAAQGNGALGIKFFVGLLIALWSANSGIKAMFDALNVAYGEQEKRSFIVLNLQSLLFTLAAIIASIGAFLAVVAAPVVFRFLGFSRVEATIDVVRWPLLALVVLLGLSILYRFGPSRKPQKWHRITWGSTVATLLWIAISVLFSWYVASIGNYSRTYGALGAIIGFMTWIWFSAIVVLLGAEINAELERDARNNAAGRAG
ncbi:MAG: YihY/virulence factor BrkB family protein [Methylovirgula sp.]